MSDPLSIAAGTAGFISLGLEVAQSLISYYKAYTGRNQYVSSALRKLENLHEILKLLDIELSRRTAGPADERDASKSMLRTIESCSSQCLEAIKELKAELEKVVASTASTGRLRDVLKTAGGRMAYPYRQETLKEIEASVDNLRSSLSTALDVLQLGDGQNAIEELIRVKESITSIRQYQVGDEIKSWLNPPDAHSNHDRALTQHHQGTSAWLLDSLPFTRWLDGTTSFLWLQGFAGRGKTVICSAAIERTIDHSTGLPDNNLGVAYYYFSFQEVSKQDTQGLLRALVFQLATQTKDAEILLQATKDRCKGVQPSQRDSCDLLRKLIQSFTAVYFLWDAIDEVPAGRARDQLLDTLRVVRSWPNVHILVTSRNLEDIRMHISPQAHEELSMRSDGQDDDIKRYISSRLIDDPRLRRWHDSHALITSTLVKKAGGVFRWVECQLRLIARLPRSEASLRSALASLPADLEETYERMLCGIDPTLAADAKKLLTILAFSCTELHDVNVLDFLAMDLESGHIDKSRRLPGEDDLHLLCPGLIETDRQSFVTIAHFSVREYLTSARIRDSKASYFALDSDTANYLLARICLVYHQRGDFYSDLVSNHWAHYYSYTTATREQLDAVILQLIDSDPNRLADWTHLVKLEQLKMLELSDFDTKPLGPTHARIFANLVTASESAGTPTMHVVGCLLYVACKYQKESMFQKVLNTRFNMDRDKHAHCVRTLLYHAVEAGLINWSQKLLEFGADPNLTYSECTFKGTSGRLSLKTEIVSPPLHVAVRDKNLVITRLLLANGADVNAVYSSHVELRDGSYENVSHQTGTALDMAMGPSYAKRAADEVMKEAIPKLLARSGGLCVEALKAETLPLRP